jgi:hypothetical protein
MPVIESDWPTEIALEVVSPLMYLKTQASALSQLTKGIIEAKVDTEETINKDNEYSYSHVLSIYASALEDAEIEILRLSHSRDLMYPCLMNSRALNRGGSLYEKNSSFQSSFDELRKTMRVVLRSQEVMGRIHSLIARINETTSR